MIFKFVGDHQEDLDGGQMLSPGDEVDLTKEQVTDGARAYTLAKEGRLIGTTKASEKVIDDITAEAQAAAQAEVAPEEAPETTEGEGT